MNYIRARMRKSARVGQLQNPTRDVNLTPAQPTSSNATTSTLETANVRQFRNEQDERLAAEQAVRDRNHASLSRLIGPSDDDLSSITLTHNRTRPIAEVGYISPGEFKGYADKVGQEFDLEQDYKRKYMPQSQTAQLMEMRRTQQVGYDAMRRRQAQERAEHAAEMGDKPYELDGDDDELSQMSDLST